MSESKGFRVPPCDLRVLLNIIIIMIITIIIIIIMIMVVIIIMRSAGASMAFCW